MKARIIGMLAAGLCGAAGLAGCASAPDNAPAWYAERAEQGERGYPDLHDAPRGTSANRDAAHWARVQSQVLAAGAAMRANPRATPAGPTDPAAFIAEAQSDLEETRDAHEP